MNQLDIHHRYPVDCRFVVEHNRPDLPRHDHECFLFHADCEPVAVADIPVEHIAASEDDLAFHCHALVPSLGREFAAAQSGSCWQNSQIIIVFGGDWIMV